MNRPQNIGRVDEAIHAAESATFHAANVCQSYLKADPDRDLLLKELCETANALRKLDRNARIFPVAENFVYDSPVLSAGGRALRRLRLRR